MYVYVVPKSTPGPKDDTVNKLSTPDDNVHTHIFFESHCILVGPGIILVVIHAFSAELKCFSRCMQHSSTQNCTPSNLNESKVRTRKRREA